MEALTLKQDDITSHQPAGSDDGYPAVRGWVGCKKRVGSPFWKLERKGAHILSQWCLCYLLR